MDTVDMKDYKFDELVKTEEGKSILSCITGISIEKLATIVKDREIEK